ncbi:hypothetical protein [Helicobacter sp. MIT 14-3879]|uniref:hypothetical protein n=1 Tax=Helicobacter sp. MIT 14-3879 TaxID=2040649 RepID=UPI000E1F8015|nr:hypothetical protein [Helicobacter sp. MIT 14-3879]RDU59782.1 hypothetical protein CQA44_11135 [Helicobacter sp. MIT 14-3879]
MTPKEFIEEAKDYADIADATYAMLHYIDENEEIDFFSDKLKSENPNPKIKPPARWIYADGIKLGYEIKKESANKSSLAQQLIDDKKIKIGQPTAYALAIEARFSQNLTIKKPKINQETNKIEYEQVKIDNKIQSFINRNKKDLGVADQTLLVATTKEKQEQDKQEKESPNNLTHHLSPRTKFFTSRFKLLHHQPNTTISGYSHTLFKDTQAKDKDDTYILAFRGTETSGKEFFKDMLLTDGFITIGVGIPQIISLVKFRNEVLKEIQKDIRDNSFKINVVGHSLGGHLAQSFCILNNENLIYKLYTYNAPGFLGILASLLNIAIRVIRLIIKLLILGVKKLFNLLGFTRKVIDKCIQTCNPKDNLENYIEYADTLKQGIGEEEIDSLANKSKKLSKAKTNIQIHHIETIKKPIPREESFAREWQEFAEPTISFISDLGYKYGLNIQDKFDYRNTQRLHLLHIGKLEYWYIGTSHFMESILQTIYFYHYLFQSPSNQDKKQLNESIEKTLDYLNSYSQILIELIYYNKLIRDPNDKENRLGQAKELDFKNNYLSIYQNEILHTLINNKERAEKEYQFNFHNDKEIIRLKNMDYSSFTKNDVINVFLLLMSVGIYTKIIDKNDMECLLQGA